MTLATDQILDVLKERGVEPTDETEDVDLPDVGEIEEGEAIYSTSIAEVFEGGDEESSDPVCDLDDGRLHEWWGEIERVIRSGGLERQFPSAPAKPREEPPEPNCAWYCPIHFCGHGWGIYIRESCILSCASEI